jgi:hypothetical protein
MQLRLKQEYLEWSIGGGSMKTIKVKDIKPRDYEKYYKIDSRFFEMIEEVIEKPKKTKKIEIEEDDFNSEIGD